MTKKDFELIAESFRLVRLYDVSTDEQRDFLDLVINNMAGDLARSNSRFDKQRFIAWTRALD